MLDRVERREAGQPCRLMVGPADIRNTRRGLRDDRRHADALAAVWRVRGCIAVSRQLHMAHVVMRMSVMSGILMLHHCRAMRRTMGVRG